VPTYEYTCTECGNPLEVVQSFSDDPLTVCPSCGGRLRKVFSAVGVVFKGAGFYRTDSRAGKDTRSKDAAAAGRGSKDGAKDGKDGAKDGKEPAGAGSTKAAATGSAASSTPAGTSGS
jgi:putative FmdB family regulatory protein